MNASLCANLSIMKLDTCHLTKLPDATLQEFIIGSETMRNVMETVRQAAPYDVNVLISGESGTGKELLAKIIHLQSSRAERPFVAVNCGVLSGLIFEDKLFGHEKGAFTGAIRDRMGCFEMAHGGTLFLDEVSELPYENQVDFLRVLDESSFMRIGGTKVIEVDVRLISATNKDLKQQINRATFREDLFYRLHVVPIHLPPLRARKEAIPMLVNHFLDLLVVKHKKARPRVMPEVLNIFNEYDWPGNVRELKNLIERIFIINDGTCLKPDMLPSDFLWHLQEPIETMDLAEVRKKAEIEAISKVLIKTGGKREKAAEVLNISPRTLRHKIQHYHIQ